MTTGGLPPWRHSHCQTSKSSLSRACGKAGCEVKCASKNITLNGQFPAHHTMVTSPHYVGMCNIEQTVLDDPYTGDCKRQALEVFVKRTWAGVPPLLSGLAVLLVVHPELTLPVSAGQCSLVMASPRCGVQLYVV
jgi:hypothetical protein